MAEQTNVSRARSSLCRMNITSVLTHSDGRFLFFFFFEIYGYQKIGCKITIVGMSVSLTSILSIVVTHS